MTEGGEMLGKRVFHCQYCGEEAILIVRKVYDGFKHIGEERVCSACDHAFADDEEAPLLKKSHGIFEGGTSKQRCSKCEYYVTDRWASRCRLTLKEVERHNTCDKFREREKQVEKAQEKPEEKPKGKDILT